MRSPSLTLLCLALILPAGCSSTSAVDALQLSARSMHRILRVARTIADLDSQDQVAAEHLGEALQFRE